MTNVFRNGDWSITKYEGSLEGDKLKHQGKFVFAEGEATGHFHTLVVDKTQDLTIVKLPNGDYVFEAKSTIKVTHPEHSMKTDLEIPAGIWRLSQRREKDWLQMVTRKVID